MTICPTCGRKCIEYDLQWNMRYTLMLLRVFAQVGPGVPIRPRDLGQFKDIQRVTYSYGKHFGVLEKVYGTLGRERRGWWQLTTHGDAFIRGLATIPLTVTTFDNEVIAQSVERVYIHESPPWQGHTYESALANSRPHPVS